MQAIICKKKLFVNLSLVLVALSTDKIGIITFRFFSHMHIHIHACFHPRVRQSLPRKKVKLLPPLSKDGPCESSVISDICINIIHLTNLTIHPVCSLTPNIHVYLYLVDAKVLLALKKLFQSLACVRFVRISIRSRCDRLTWNIREKKKQNNVSGVIFTLRDFCVFCIIFSER